jgi:hypothetical protein
VVDRVVVDSPHGADAKLDGALTESLVGHAVGERFDISPRDGLKRGAPEERKDPLAQQAGVAVIGRGPTVPLRVPFKPVLQPPGRSLDGRVSRPRS